MTRTSLIATLFIACCAISTGASGQQVYKCGKTYSQIPCPGAVILDTRDTRSKAQKQQSQRVLERDTALAKDLEAARTQDDAMALAGGVPAEEPAPQKTRKSAKAKSKSPSSKDPSEGKAKGKDKKKKEEPYFTAKTGPDTK